MRLTVTETHQNGFRSKWKAENRLDFINKVRERFNVYIDPDDFLGAQDVLMQKLNLVELQTEER